MLFGLAHTFQALGMEVHVYANHWDSFQSTGAQEFLQSLVPTPAQPYDAFWKVHADYGLAVWKGHWGWDFEERRMPGPRGIDRSTVHQHRSAASLLRELGGEQSSSTSGILARSGSSTTNLTIFFAP